MRGTVAKRLRREARKEAKNQPTGFRMINKVRRVFKGRAFETATVLSTGYRQIYQRKKQAYRESQRRAS